MSRQVRCEDFKGLYYSADAAQHAIEYIQARGGKRRGMPRYVIRCGEHFHISSKNRLQVEMEVKTG